jgi:hypothetical protein
MPWKMAGLVLCRAADACGRIACVIHLSKALRNNKRDGRTEDAGSGMGFSLYSIMERVFCGRLTKVFPEEFNQKGFLYIPELSSTK